jgi:cyanosortase A-associated protein
MIYKQRLQIPILISTCLTVFVILGKLILAPTPARQATPTAFEFPPQVPLPQWQLSASRSLEQKPNTKLAQQRLLSSKLYEYQQNKLPIQIEMRYTIEPSGNVMGFLSSYTSIPLSAIQPSLRDERQKPGIGYYLVFVNQQRAYLTSCINPSGGSTVTLPQFRHNRYKYDIRLDRLLGWLLAAQNIRDDRCLWVNMSIPLQEISQETAYSVLENIWVSWYAWWQPRFPKS